MICKRIDLQEAEFAESREGGVYMDVGRIAGNAVAEAGQIGKTNELKREEPAPEALPQQEAQCTLHISDEAFRKWEMLQESGGLQAAETVQEEGTVQQTQEAQPAVEPASEEVPEDRMTRLQKFLDAYRDVFAKAKAKPQKETDDEKVAALEQLRKLKEEQEAVYRKKEAEAQALAKKRTKTQNIVEKGMRELTIMLESVRSMDEEEKKRASTEGPDKENQRDSVSRRKNEESGPDTRETMQRLGSGAKQHALRKELGMDTTIGHIVENMCGNIEFVRNEDRVLQKGLERLYYVLQQDEVSETDKEAAVDAYIMDGRVSVYNMNIQMGMGLERLKNLRMLSLGHLENQNVVYAGRAQEAISALADQTAIDEWYQDSFRMLENKNLEELEEHIRDLYEQERDPKTVPEDKQNPENENETVPEGKEEYDESAEAAAAIAEEEERLQ